MKIKLSVLVCFLCVTTVYISKASASSNIEIDKSERGGFNFSLTVAPSDSYITSKSSLYGSESGKTQSDFAPGIGIGFDHFEMNEIGYSTQLTFIENRFTESTTGEGGQIQTLRISGDLNYTFNQMLILKGGVNASKIINTAGYLHVTGTDFKLGFGYQISLNVQLSQKFGLNLGYCEINLPFEDSVLEPDNTTYRVSSNIKTYGPEMSLMYNF